MVLKEKSYDRKLQIQTTGLREWGKKDEAYNRYEATPYSALKKFFAIYKFKEDDHVIDFGSGRGRVAFFIHDKFDIPVTGVEANDKTIDEAFKNKESYMKKRHHLKAPIMFDFALAEQYAIRDDATCFYFFNPFSLRIFKQVIHNILQSFKRNERTLELILYYPLPSFKTYIQTHTPFEMINKLPTPGDHGKYGKFVVYRLEPATESE